MVKIELRTISPQVSERRTFRFDLDKNAHNEIMKESSGAEVHTLPALQESNQRAEKHLTATGDQAIEFKFFQKGQLMPFGAGNGRWYPLASFSRMSIV